jgi:hypothetical protein
VNAELAALTIRERYLGVTHLTGTGLLTELGYGFGQMADSADMRMRKKPAVRVYRQCSVKLNPTILYKRPTFALLAEAVVLQRDEYNGGKAIVYLGNIHVGGRESGHLKRLPSCPAGSGVRHVAAGNNFTVFARRAGAQYEYRWLLTISGSIGRCNDQSCGTIRHQGTIKQSIRVSNHWRVLVIFDRDVLSHLGSRIQTRMMAARDSHGSELLRRSAIFMHVSSCRQGILDRCRPRAKKIS